MEQIKEQFFRLFYCCYRKTYLGQFISKISSIILCTKLASFVFASVYNTSFPSLRLVISPDCFKFLKWCDTAGELISTAAAISLTHSSVWQRSQRIRSLVLSQSMEKMSAAIKNCCSVGMEAIRSARLPPWLWRWSQLSLCL